MIVSPPTHTHVQASNPQSRRDAHQQPNISATALHCATALDHIIHGVLVQILVWLDFLQHDFCQGNEQNPSWGRMPYGDNFWRLCIVAFFRVCLLHAIYPYTVAGLIKETVKGQDDPKKELIHHEKGPRRKKHKPHNLLDRLGK